MKRRTHFTALALAAVMSVGYIALPTQYSPAVSVSAAMKLSAPSGLSYSATTDTITLKWDELSGADAYRIYMLANDAEITGEEKLYMIDDDLYFVYKTVTGNSCSVKGLSKGNTYHFRIAALEKNDGKYIEGTKTGIIAADTKAYALPKAPNANYTGVATSGGIKYYYNNGKLTSGFVKTKNGYMYFDPHSYAMQTGFVISGGNTYYFGTDGIMFTNGTYKIGGETYVIGADGKAKVSSQSSQKKTSTSKTTQKAKTSYPSIFSYGFSDYTSYAYKKGYDSFDVCAISYSSNGMDYFYSYLDEWRDLGYVVDIGEIDSDYTNYSLNIPVTIYNGYTPIAVIIYGFYADTGIRIVTVSYM